MPKPVFLQPKVYLVFRRKKYHKFKIMEKMQSLQRTTCILFKLQFEKEFLVMGRYDGKKPGME